MESETSSKAAENCDSSFYIGQRVMVADEIFGTVAYIGPIPNSSGTWLGVDWDDEGRGRHDGTHQGRRYFTTHHPTSGSFVRPNKVSGGISLLEAIDVRYCRNWEQLLELQKNGLIAASGLPANLPVNPLWVDLSGDQTNNAANSSQQPGENPPSFMNNPTTSGPSIQDGDSLARRRYQPFKFPEQTMVSGLDPKETPLCRGMPCTDGSNNSRNASNDYASTTAIVPPGCIPLSKVQIELVGFSDSIVTKEDLCRQKQMLLHGVPLATCSQAEVERCLEIFQKVIDLNVAHTLLSDWWTLARICGGFSKLSTLSVSENLLRLPLVVKAEKKSTFEVADPLHYQAISEYDYQRMASGDGPFQNLRKLVAVRMRYTWWHFSLILPWFQRLEHLVMAYNFIDGISDAPLSFSSHLRTLDLAGNAISSQKLTQMTINSLALLPNLETLYLNECEFPDFMLPISEEVEENTSPQKYLVPVQRPLPGNVFPKLKSIALCRNQISSWTTLDHLNRLPSLEEFSFMDNPILETCANYDTARQWIIARMARIRVLNRNEISKDERRGAEIDYLRVFGREWVKNTRNFEFLQLLSQQDEKGLEEITLSPDDQKKREAFAQVHPRYEDLIRIHGPPEIGELRQFTCALRECLLAVTISCPEMPEAPPVHKKLPSRMTVQHLQALVRRTFKLPTSRPIRLVYTHYRTPQVEYELEAPTREVGFYEIENGDELKVHLL